MCQLFTALYADMVDIHKEHGQSASAVAKRPTKKTTAEQPRPMGTPSLYRPEFAPLLIEHMKSGLGLGSFAAEVGVGRSTVYDWINPKHTSYQPDFSDAYEMGCAHRQAFHEKNGIMGIYGQIKSFSPAAWQFMMRNVARTEFSDAPAVTTNVINAEHVDLTGVPSEELHALAMASKDSAAK